ncbi:hypothetical protein JBF11_02145 [Taurinivorans muris]|uniref:Uncharacterized protein n=1 Tax=Taurinivorans muris TaxID=2787751 RepID=A0ABY5Y1S6_9BACT|nr:hypothetical protein JBF11_02145 [Desulfovibrionaceae bacterium LT0009]
MPKKIFLVKQIFTNICFFMNGKVFHVQSLAGSTDENSDTVSGAWLEMMILGNIPRTAKSVNAAMNKACNTKLKP